MSKGILTLKRASTMDHFIRYNSPYNENSYQETAQISDESMKIAERNKNNPENYKLISPLTTMKKIFQNMLYKRVLKFFGKNHLSALRHLVFDQNVIVFIQFAQQPNTCVPKLSKKLNGQACFIDSTALIIEYYLREFFAYGYRRPVYELLEDYLKYRKQHVWADDKSS